MNKTVDTLMRIIASEICGYPCDIAQLNEEELASLYKLSRSHDIAHIVGNALDKAGALRDDTDTAKSFKKQTFLAVFRYEQINYEYERLCTEFEKEKIAFLPLKGSVLRELYPEPWMRTSSDVDILLHREDLDRAVEHLSSSLGYERSYESPHDVSLYSKSGVHIELHFALSDEGKTGCVEEMLGSVWDHTVKKKDREYWYLLSDEMFFFYHIAHMARHFEGGGCGIKSFIDLWLLDNKTDHDPEKREDLLSRGGLAKFAETVRRLADAWFSGGERDDTLEKLENYLLDGGVYGNKKNRIVMKSTKAGSRLNYALGRIFLPYRQIKYLYPSLQKYPWLTPVYEVYRWLKLLFCGRAKNSFSELAANSNITKQEEEETRQFLSDIGL